MPSQSTNVFVSYSHADASLVAPVVELLRANKSLVFQDTDSIPPGKRWRSEIAKALDESHLVVVFWCDHASRSDEVSKEWNTAIEQQKNLLPLLLDATPLPPELDEFQWIDFRGIVGANHSSIDSSANDVKTRRPKQWLAIPSARWLSVPGLAVTFATAAALYLFRAEREPAPVVPKPSVPPVPPVESFDFVLTLLLLSVFAVTACLLWLWRRKRVESQPRDIERRIANELEAEILRRTALRRDGRA